LGAERVCGLGVGDRDADCPAEWLGLGLGLVALAVPDGEILAVAEGVLPGENVGEAEGVDEQAETDAETNMAKVAQPAAVSLVLRRVPMVVRIFMGPPHASCKWSRSRHGNRNRVAEPAAARIGLGQVSESAAGHMSRSHGQHRYAMACSSLEF
jgi:hypothetical protein